MNWQILTSWLPRLKNTSRSQEAGAALFRGLRIRLTLWYCGVMGAALVLFGVALYIGTQYFLLSPIQSDAQNHAQVHANDWRSDSAYRACPPVNLQFPSDQPPRQFVQRFELVACFDQTGKLLTGENTLGMPDAFLTDTLVLTALRSGQPVQDTIDAGGTTGQIYRYAMVVTDSTGKSILGVVMIGESVQSQESALSLLLTLLLSIGGVALLGAGLGGLFLSNRALAPARLAWTNQQRFIADASHELRTPLTLLRADAEVLLRGRKHMDEEDAFLLEDIVSETQHMSNLATNLLTLARLDNSVLHRDHEILNLADLAQQGVRRVQALADQRGITIKVENLGVPAVIGDPMLLEQSTLVLLDNAIKYNRVGGTIQVRTTIQNMQAIFEVSDTGVGISAEHLPHLGERFYRVDKARSREAGGTGLGLSIARNIAITHGGQLTFSSTPGQGTTATLTLPLASRGQLEARKVEVASGPVGNPPK